MVLKPDNRIGQVFYQQFPWLNGCDIFLYNQIDPNRNLSELPISDLVHLLFEKFSDIRQRILTILIQIINNQENFSTPTNDLTHLALYPIIRMIISMMGNRVLGNGLANLYAKHAQDELSKINSDLVLVQICNNIGIECEIVNSIVLEKTKYLFRMYFPSYLRASTKITDEYWKLINRPILKGYVYLIRSDVIMLIREMVRQKSRPDYSQVDKSFNLELHQISELGEIIQQIEQEIEKNAQRFQSDLLPEGEKVGSDLFAPCIRAILYKATQGENMGHTERLAIAFYFLNTNHSIEETVDIFRTSPDFDEKIARYQVEFAAGEGGKGKKYTMYSCAKLKTLNICKATDPIYGEELCAQGAIKKDGTRVPIKNPTGNYIFWKQVEFHRMGRQNERIQLQNQQKTQITQQQEFNGPPKSTTSSETTTTKGDEPNA